MGAKRSERLTAAIGKLQDGLNEVQQLADEMETWRINMDGTNLENTQKYGDVSECADALIAVAQDLESVISDLQGI